MTRSVIDQSTNKQNGFSIHINLFHGCCSRLTLALYFSVLWVSGIQFDLLRSLFIFLTLSVFLKTIFDSLTTFPKVVPLVRKTYSLTQSPDPFGDICASLFETDIILKSLFFRSLMDACNPLRSCLNNSLIFGSGLSSLS